jgi:hypothetical protein
VRLPAFCFESFRTRRQMLLLVAKRLWSLVVSDAKMITVANILLASILSGNCPVASFAEVVKSS